MKQKSLVQLTFWLAVLVFILACGLNSQSAPPNNTTTMCTTTNNIGLPLSGDICAKANNNITISSADGKAHSCTFQGSNTVKISLPAGKSVSDGTSIGAGEYTLTCDGTPKSVKVTVSAQ